MALSTIFSSTAVMAIRAGGQFYERPDIGRYGYGPIDRCVSTTGRTGLAGLPTESISRGDMYGHPLRTSPIHRDHGETVLWIRRCRECRALFAPQTSVCPTCTSAELAWMPSSGLGSIVSWRLEHHSAGNDPAEVMPRTIAVVELDDGPWIFTTIDGEVPPPARGSVRVRFLPHVSADGFPVFTVCHAATETTERGRRAAQCANAPTDLVPSLPSARHYDSVWIRAALQQCEVLARADSIDSTSRSVIAFAIRWAPFGGAGARELLVAFGVTRRRFLQKVEDALRPRRTDTVTIRGLKRQLQVSLTQAWHSALPLSMPQSVP
ncbi:OB-fold domain-containing protein [Nocardia fluminea]|uniref:Zn-ribbon domain-containing OB-fold protein n=1 Tax=Nocardia fluminea TaxID=134984 RepID=UPI0034301C73